MAVQRDMTRAQYLAALKRNEMAEAVFGYVEMLGGALSVYAPNGVGARRARLAYLLKTKAMYEKQMTRKEAIDGAR
jgi:hypothetical protein